MIFFFFKKFYTIRKYHPDKNPGDKKAEEKFIELAKGNSL